MLPFCGYNMADYWGHWLKIGESTDADKLPRIYQVNWFRKDAEGKFLWPGFGENSRVLDWIIRRLEGDAEAVETPIGYLPAEGSLNVDGLGLSDEQLSELFAVEPKTWIDEAELTEQYFTKFGDHVPAKLTGQLVALQQRLEAAQQG
jgi:phosphoenolpyruvate carboxykinase (GTP)